MEWMNYNQFFYFWIIAQEMSVTRAAKRLRLSQSNLSEQLIDFETAIGQPLFDRGVRQLRLTESGRIALECANSIFTTGHEMLDLFRNRPTAQAKKLVRIGAVAGLSKNMQFSFIRPLLNDHKTKTIVLEHDLNDLIRSLQNHELDVVISNTPANSQVSPEVFSHRLDDVPVSVVGAAKFRGLSENFPASLADQPLYLPSRSGPFRADFEAWLETRKVIPDIRSEVEDMALLRLLVLSGQGMALVPEIVVQSELRSRQLFVIQRLKNFKETFYAITTTRRFPNQQIESLVKNFVR